MSYCLVIQGLDENNVRCIKTRFDFPYVIRHVAYFKYILHSIQSTMHSESQLQLYLFIGMIRAAM